jgi:mono/diheme cytochrome c family protein
MWMMVLGVMLIIGCAREPLPARPGVESTSPPPAEQAVTTPSHTPPPRRLTQGETLYIRHCADCHGWEGRGNGALAHMLLTTPPPLRRTNLFTQYTESELVVRVLLGKDLQVPFASSSLLDTDAEVTALFTYLKRLPTVSWDQADKGAQVYDSLCASCHGLYGAGDGLLAAALPVPPRDLSTALSQNQVSDEELWRVIADGKGDMPGAADVLTPDEIQAVIVFVRLLSPGYELYDRFCAICHGPTGRPIAITLPDPSDADVVPTEIPTFDEEYFRTHSEDHVRLWIRHMLQENRTVMPHFSGELNAEEVRQIVAYLRSLPPES